VIVGRIMIARISDAGRMPVLPLKLFCHAGLNASRPWSSGLRT
jgi:hypothetical protein